MKELLGQSISQLRALIETGEVSAREIYEAHLAHLEASEPQIQAFNVLTRELGRRQADQIDRLRQAGAPLPAMAGVPVAIKDNICVPGYPTTCSSKILAGFKPRYTATAAKRLFDAGALCLGKTNMDEFAMGSSTENSAFQLTRNPWDQERVPGGSSGGSSAAVAAGFATVALGSDTGGSIRQPASFCGVVGMKPTYGYVSRFGLVAFASSLDQIGPIARSVKDAAICLEAIAGHDRRDSTALDTADMNFTERLETVSAEELVRGRRIGVIKELTGAGIDADVREPILAAAKVFEKLGAAVEEVSLPHARFSLPVYYIIATAEASANLARYDGVRYGLRSKDADDLISMYMNTRQEGFGNEVKRRIMLGTYALSSGYYDAYYKKAQQVRQLIKQDFEQIFSQVDVLISPTAPSVAFRLGEKTDDPLQMYLSDIATIPANLAGLPGISLPCGSGKDGLPVGLQLIGPALGDKLLLEIAQAYEQTTEFHEKASPLLQL